jgi:hypothetical protein
MECVATNFLKELSLMKEQLKALTSVLFQSSKLMLSQKLNYN